MNNMPENIYKANNVNPLKTFLGQDHYISTYKHYAKNMSLFIDKHKKQFSDKSYQKFGTNYDITFGFDMDLSLWAWAQHYGIPTPLVDWTTNASNALYFACSSKCKSSKISIFALNTSSLAHYNRKDIPYIQSHTIVKENEYIDAKDIFSKSKPIYESFFDKMPITFIDNKDYSMFQFNNFYDLHNDMRKLKLISSPLLKDDNPRITVQSGFFTFSPAGMSIEEWCRRIVNIYKKDCFWISKNKHNFSYITIAPLVEKYSITITEKERLNCLKFLDNVGINAKNLYPDFQGISKYLIELQEQHQHNKK